MLESFIHCMRRKCSSVGNFFSTSKLLTQKRHRNNTVENKSKDKKTTSKHLCFIRISFKQSITRPA